MKPTMKIGNPGICPWCKAHPPNWIEEWMVTQGERIQYHRCVLCGERYQDHVPDASRNNPMLRHRMPDGSMVGG